MTKEDLELVGRIIIAKQDFTVGPKHLGKIAVAAGERMYVISSQGEPKQVFLGHCNGNPGGFGWTLLSEFELTDEFQE